MRNCSHTKGVKIMNIETSNVNTLKPHFALNVKDVEKSLEFYKKMLGIEPSKVRAGYAKFDVQNPPLNLTLNQSVFEGRGALSHLGIQVASTEDVLAMREKWHEQGLFTRDEMDTSCCYAVQDKTWVHDPDGNEWEAFVVKEDNLPEIASSIAGNAACCVPASAATETKAADSSCGCESSPPAAGQDPCCEKQAEKFGISYQKSSDVSCAPSPVAI